MARNTKRAERPARDPNAADVRDDIPALAGLLVVWLLLAI